MSTFRQKVQATTNWVKPDPEDMADAPKTSRRAAKRRKAPQPPVTAHRLFPAFAALWLAALLGLGSLAIPGSSLGVLVTAIGLPALVPAAAPPLGFTAHLLVAFALALVGAALGLAVALRLRPRTEAAARPVEPVVPAAEPDAENVYKVRARDAHPDAPPRRPLVLTEAFGDPLGDASAEIETETGLLRRKLVHAASDVPESEAADESGPWIAKFAPGGIGAGADADTAQPLDLSALDLSALDLADPVEACEHEAEPAPAPSAPALIAATPQLPIGFAASLPDVSAGAWSPVAGVPLENLGLVQLIERLALAIAARKAATDEGSPPPAGELEPHSEPAEPAFAPGPFSMSVAPGTPTEADPLAAAPPLGSAREAILHRLGAVDSAPPFSRLARITAQAPAEAVVQLRPAETAGPSFAPPAAAPAAAPATSAPFEADEVLRSALATLQRMTARG